ncbi:hypothetical protein Q5H93_01455 [Hymenobacter sp. ASUV-10]|uniref:Uncharacterized protein n=1 Tax=Hymenobacter aranciens TaxID=3063996 RepID=A0ABT9B555_9BACT|nr:hypothetical protein [Hymenobacter sp. ASUV-10]MDO7873379.1 hypothetical protein [Hymenobacter sp. ASUV-10]
MADRLLLTFFENVPKPRIGPLAQNCIDTLITSPFLPNREALMMEVKERLSIYLPLAALTRRTEVQTIQFNNARQALNNSLTAVAKYANDLVPDNEEALLSTGLPLAKLPEKHTTLLPPAEFSLHDGTAPDTLCAKVKRTKHSAATEIRYTDDPSLPWYLWLAVTTTRAKATLRGFRKKTEVFMMCRAVGGDTDDQPFSAVVSRVVQ